MSGLKRLKNIISEVAGIDVEITIIAEKKFSFFFEGKNETASSAIINYLKSANKENTILTSDYDIECDSSCIYMTLK